MLHVSSHPQFNHSSNEYGQENHRDWWSQGKTVQHENDLNEHTRSSSRQYAFLSRSKYQRANDCVVCSPLPIPRAIRVALTNLAGWPPEGGANNCGHLANV